MICPSGPTLARYFPHPCTPLQYCCVFDDIGCRFVVLPCTLQTLVQTSPVFVHHEEINVHIRVLIVKQLSQTLAHVGALRSSLHTSHSEIVRVSKTRTKPKSLSHNAFVVFPSV